VPIVVKAREIGVIVTVARTWSSLYSRVDRTPVSSEQAQALPGLLEAEQRTAAPVSTHRTWSRPPGVGFAHCEAASRTCVPETLEARQLARDRACRAFLHALGLLKGDYVELVLDEYAGRFYCKPVKRRTLKRRRGAADRAAGDGGVMKVTPDRRYDFRVVPLALIDPPPIAMREQMDDRALEALADNIKRNGILQPPGVIEADGRFRIVWGHRRFEASKLAGEIAIPVRVLYDAEITEEELKIAENAHQEPVNPMGEASYYADILERKFGGDIEKMSDAIHVPISTINGRLELLLGWPDVQDALRAGKIGSASRASSIA
jgi:ParB/RepB/Spo0J family partition protein